MFVFYFILFRMLISRALQKHCMHLCCEWWIECQNSNPTQLDRVNMKCESLSLQNIFAFTLPLIASIANKFVFVMRTSLAVCVYSSSPRWNRVTVTKYLIFYSLNGIYRRKMVCCYRRTLNVNAWTWRPYKNTNGLLKRALEDISQPT